MAKTAVVHPRGVGAEFVWRMENILKLYAEEYEPERPQVCFDEMPYQLIKEKRTPLLAEPGVPERYDYEYERAGTRNPFYVLRAP